MVLYTAGEYERALRDAGFDDVEMDTRRNGLLFRGVRV
jgi:hypothetical protein